MITRCYLEITNICNLDCLFCPKTDRAKHRLSLEEFETLTDKLCGQIKFLYFHLMGEPFLHPRLSEFIQIARRKDFVPVLTTNGTLLSKAQGVIEAHPHKIQNAAGLSHTYTKIEILIINTFSKHPAAQHRHNPPKTRRVIAEIIRK